MSTIVKICGITNIDDAFDAIELGADYLGFNFYPDSPRYVSPEKLNLIITEIPYSVKKVGIFVNCAPQVVIDIATQFDLDLLQFHGDEKAAYCNQFARPFIKAIRPKNESDLLGLEEFQADYFLVDSFVSGNFGGTGIVSNWDLARQVKKLGKPIFLSGGLDPDNVEMAIGAVKPFGVDVASGVEFEPGKKDYHKMNEFIQKVKNGK